MDNEEEKFYTWDEIEKELTDLELQYGDSDEIVRNIITPSVSAYWRKKLEEEKILYEKKLQTKEEEKKQVLLKLQEQEQLIEDLKKQIEKLERGQYEKLKDQYEELRRKELDLEKEKEKLVWQQQIQGLEFDKKIIEQEIERTRKDFEQQKQELLVYYNRQFNSLLEVQKELIEETQRLEQEIDRIVVSANDEIKKVLSEKEELLKELQNIKQLSEEIKRKNEQLIVENGNLTKKIDELRQSHIQDKRQLVLNLTQNVRNYITEIRNLCGVLIGAANFINSYTKYKRSVKFHIELILNIVQRILSILDEIVKSLLEYPL
ncbi:MAG: hypothetical protein NZ928_04105 [Endomicrobia bacterium]|nr:hypothetical protein [Endomicrobiia bacterium]MDW8056078.1 hypothetical protein [Elusimicrobiota bacterium]